MPLYIDALIVHGILGALDVFVNHEWLARLPSRREARTEQRVHSAREAVFGSVFLALAWFEWHGAAAACIVLPYLVELALSALDMLVEGEIRVLPRAERVLHVFLFVNLGALLVLVGGALLDWRALPTAVVPVHHGWASWVLSALALGAFAWSVRDALAARALGRAPSVISNTNHRI